ncbi:TKL protein kinase, variant 1 [Aphanomyces astaci]|uniref:TKL protein kinase, variant 1 n=1 Tax=Aphanomyces astaci TaxID=112090 RepID=W4GMS6_APHAT|nr:TKL protein kinase, variant 1 [Aphanomyces astaci]ETV80329.1 TKL protein kinase, variant 1 [Aphanomyces astaci]|eukprot:XP_009830253.1 TKL protein kinase, variant 1 [Aphanomyces astaci]
MGCNNSKEEPRESQRPLTANEYYPAPPPGNFQLPRSNSGFAQSHRGFPGISGRRQLSAAPAPAVQASDMDIVYAPLLQLKKFWIDPDDCGSSRALKSSYMHTHVGYYQGHPTVIKSFLGFNKRPANVVEKERNDLIKEIRALSKLSHPNIVAFLGFTYTTVDNLKCVTEFMDGGNLRTLLNNPKRELSWRREKLTIALDVASALQYLHSLKPKIMHRNIKAEKVLLTASLSAKLSGFGSAREWSYTQTMTQKVGTIEWSAPELLLNEDYNEKIDIYSFGVLLVELDTRDLPYANAHPDTSNALVTNIITGVVRPTVSPSCPKSISKLVRACLQLDSLLRPSADAIVQVLREEQARVADAVVEKLQIKHQISSRAPRSTVSSSLFDTSHPDFKHLAPLRTNFWIHARDCVVSRQIPSSYMSTLLGHYRGDAVVVKTLNLTLPHEYVAQDRKYLVREIVMMAKLAHPNIVAFRGFTFTTKDDLKCVTEFMAGGTLRALLDKKKRELTWHSEKLRLAMDVALGLAYLHGQAPTLMHRNIKASKVLLTPGLGAKLSGFGFARVWTSQETMTAAVGTMEWAAPELLRNEDYSIPADVYSFGVLLTELDTRLIPYADIRDQGASLSDESLMVQIVTGKLRPTVSPSCPRPIQKLIHSCLHVNPAQRPTMAAVVAILEQEKLIKMGL